MGSALKAPRFISPGQRPGFPQRLRSRARKGRGESSMPQSLAKSLLQPVFSAKTRAPVMVKPAGVPLCTYAGRRARQLATLLFLVLLAAGCGPTASDVQRAIDKNFQLCVNAADTEWEDCVKPASNRFGLAADQLRLTCNIQADTQRNRCLDQAERSTRELHGGW